MHKGWHFVFRSGAVKTWHYRWFYVMYFDLHVVSRLDICWLITTKLLNLRKTHNIRHFCSGSSHIKSFLNVDIFLMFTNHKVQAHSLSLNSDSCVSLICASGFFIAAPHPGFLLILFFSGVQMRCVYFASIRLSVGMLVQHHIFTGFSMNGKEKGFPTFF